MNRGPSTPRIALRAGALSPCIACLCLLFPVLLLSGGCGGGDEAGERDADVSTAEQWETPGGRWHPLREGAATEEQLEEIEKLKSIGYLAGSTRPPEIWGVTVYDSTRAWDGLNFYTSGDAPGAILMDMRGNVLHKWTYSFMDAWRQGPGGELPRSSKGAGFWRRAHLFKNGDVLAIFDGHGIIKVDRNSKLVWARFGGFHHDLDVMSDGRIYTLLREPKIIPRINPDHPVLEEFIVVLDADGSELRRVSQLEAIERGGRLDLLEGMKDDGDIFHTNTIEVLDGSLAARDPAFRAGNVLICIRELDNIAIVDMDSEQVVWGLEGPWLKQHQPTVLENGNMLIFDNGGSRGASRVLEFDPVTREIVWVYKGDANRLFHSPQCGSNERLPNGDTLISETDRGRALEVTPEGEIVWEYVNPAQAGDEGQYIASLFEVIRIPRDYVKSWLRME
ncbi:MAG: hypothetical protein JXB46_01280 [Candidatus Eisenbacteria bacterium]|nr:hypothetical protein [Candidatus Eisenbacteria bacterium]